MKIDKKNIIFNDRVSIEQIEEGTELCPKFNQEGLIPCITIEYELSLIHISSPRD